MFSNATHRRTARRGSLVALAAAGALLAGGSPSALAAEIVDDGPNSYAFNAAPGELNNLTITQATATSITFDDPGGAITAMAATCNAASATNVTCTPVAAGTVATVTASLDDGTDIATATNVGDLPGSTASVVMNGGEGNDTLSVTNALAGVVNSLNGQAGDDTINGSAGDDTISGGDGNDLTLSGGDGVDTITGGAGNDTLSGGAGNDNLDGGADTDTLSGGADNDTLDGGLGDDVVDGGTGNDQLSAEDGADDIHGGADSDTFSAVGAAARTITLDNAANDGTSGQRANVHSDIESVFTDAGNDDVTAGSVASTIFTRGGDDVIDAFGNGVIDTIACGTGTDTVYADANDIVVADVDPISACENVQRSARPAPSPPADPGTPPVNPIVNPIVVPVVPIITTPAVKLPSAKSVSAKATPSRDRSKPYRFTVKGKVTLPTGVTKAKGCSGSVTVTGKRGTKTAGTKKVFLKKDCSYSATMTITGKGKLKIAAKFNGNKVAGAKTSASLNARAG